MLNKKLRVGIAGTGWMGEQHILAVAPSEFFELVAVADTDTEKAKYLLSKNGINSVKVVGDYYDLLDLDIDMISDVTPNALHQGHTLDALRAGKHVFSEKPAFVSLDKLVEVCDFLEDNPKNMLFVDYVLNGHDAYTDIVSNLDKKIPPDYMRLVFYHQVGLPKGPRHWKCKPELIHNAGAQAFNHAFNLAMRVIEISGARPVRVQTLFSEDDNPFNIPTKWTTTIWYEKGGKEGYIQFKGDMNPGKTKSEKNPEGYDPSYNLQLDGYYLNGDRLMFDTCAPKHNQLMIIRGGEIIRPDKKANKPDGYASFAGDVNYHPTPEAYGLIQKPLQAGLENREDTETIYRQCPLAIAHPAVLNTELVCLALIESNANGGKPVEIKEMFDVGNYSFLKG